MDDLIVITCYQFDITDKLIKLLGKGNCLLVVDDSSPDFPKFDKYSDITISRGPFGYYSVEEALGRVQMMRNLMEVTNGDFNRLHIISQNDLPTLGWFSRDKIIDKDSEYIHIHGVDKWMSNYMTVTPKLCKLLNEKESEVIEFISKLPKMKVINDIPSYSGFKGAPSENLWIKYVIDLPNRVNSDLRLYTYSDDYIYGFKGKTLGSFTKPTSPLTLEYRENTLKCLNNDGWYLFARKFEYNSELYNYWYELIWNKINE